MSENKTLKIIGETDLESCFIKSYMSSRPKKFEIIWQRVFQYAPKTTVFWHTDILTTKQVFRSASCVLQT